MLVLLGLAATAVWWVRHGGLRGSLVEVERAEPQVADFDVDINTADWPELVQLPAIGETLARRIVASRQKDGPFRDHNDLRRVRGIGPKTLERIRPYLRPMEGKGGGRKEERRREAMINDQWPLAKEDIDMRHLAIGHWALVIGHSGR